MPRGEEMSAGLEKMMKQLQFPHTASSDLGKELNNYWKLLDDLAAQDPAAYKAFLQAQQEAAEK